MASRSGRTSAALVVTSALLTVCVLGTGVAAAAPFAASGPSPMWAYGVLKTVDFHGAGANFTYVGNATLGFSVVFNETQNASDGLVTVNAVRTVGAIVNVEYCVPSCSSPVAVATLSHHAWETTDAWANLTTEGTVYEASVPVAALALINSSVGVTAYLRDSGVYLGGATVLLERTLAVNVSGHVAVSLTPALGLFPLNLIPGATWNSSSAYSGSGSVAWNLNSTDWGTKVTSPHNGTGSGYDNASKSGTITVTGSYPSGSNVTFQGTSYPAINLTLGGPFALGEGVILVPASADLFGSATQNWTADQVGSAVVTMERLDVHPGSSYDGHLPIIASGSSWVSSTAYSGVSEVPVGSGPLPAAPAPSAAAISTFIQAQPESVSSAQSDQHCLLTGIGCGSPSGPVSPVRWIVLAGVATVAVAVIAMTLVARRRPPAPVYPNSALYPPGAYAPGAPSPAPPPPPAEDDPLGHLW